MTTFREGDRVRLWHLTHDKEGLAVGSVGVVVSVDSNDVLVDWEEFSEGHTTKHNSGWWVRRDDLKKIPVKKTDRKKVRKSSAKS